MINIGIFCADYFSPYKPYFRRQAEAFDKSRPVVFTWSDGGDDTSKVEVISIGCSWEATRFHPLIHRALYRIGIRISSVKPSDTARIESLLKEHEIDVIIAQTGFASDKISGAACRAGIPYITHLRGADLREAMKVRGWGRRLAKVCNLSAHVLVVGKYMADQLVSLGVDRSKILIEPTGAPVHNRTPSENVGADNTFVFVGRLVPCKAVGVIIDAIGEAKRRGSTIHLNIIGDGPMRAQLEEHASDLGIDDRVHFLGERNSEEVDKFLDESGALVIHTVDHPGGPEAFGVVVTEAMASARPVITSRCGGLIDQIIDGEQGLVIEQRDVSGLADAFIRLGGDPQLRAKMGKSARVRAANLFDATDLAHNVERLAISSVVV